MKVKKRCLSLLCFKRAGAYFITTYFSEEAALCLNK
ncbi:hypothetical protein [Bacteroidetes bacterium endosymbiont of Geopemphigus sp.]